MLLHVQRDDQPLWQRQGLEQPDAPHHEGDIGDLGEDPRARSGCPLRCDLEEDDRGVVSLVAHPRRGDEGRRALVQVSRAQQCGDLLHRQAEVQAVRRQQEDVVGGQPHGAEVDVEGGRSLRCARPAGWPRCGRA